MFFFIFQQQIAHMHLFYVVASVGKSVYASDWCLSIGMSVCPTGEYWNWLTRGGITWRGQHTLRSSIRRPNTLVMLMSPSNICQWLLLFSVWVYEINTLMFKYNNRCENCFSYDDVRIKWALTQIGLFGLMVLWDNF